MTNEHTTCVVAGGGPAGMVLGLLLARAGIEVTVLEKHGDFLRDFRGDTVHASTLRLLDELGLAERFRELPYSTVDRMAFPQSDGKTVTMADFTTLPGRYQYIAMVPQWDLLNMLAEAGKLEPAFALRMNTEATDVITDDGRVTGVRYRTSDGSTGELHADLTVAADGRWSVLRDAMHLVPHEFPVPMDTWWFRIPKRDKETDPSGLSAQLGSDDVAVVIGRSEYFQIAYLFKKGNDSVLRARGIQAFRDRLAELLPWAADRVDTIAGFDDVKLLDVRLNRLPRWYADGLLCIGDAAHAMSPVGGVGINLAIQDAVAAARLLAEPLARHAVTTADLAAVQRRRLLPTMLTQGLQRVLHRVLVDPVINGRRDGRTFRPWIMGVVPMLRRVPAYLVGIGFRPEHAPDFARRNAQVS
jgi:2-polyprenyl-6-methoxyphenol hydroxylase-like FAD-dependent oxidoreductase